MEQQASFIIDFYRGAQPSLVPGTDVSSFPLPALDPRNQAVDEVGADLMGMFRDSPAARQLVDYLTTAGAQTVWARRGGYLAPNRGVHAAAYPDPVSRALAQRLTDASAVRYDASDLMPAAMQSAFYKAVLEYVTDPRQLDRVLSALDKIQATAYS
jgi:alpha-glucoside transport system substrate-binding protein